MKIGIIAALDEEINSYRETISALSRSEQAGQPQWQGRFCGHEITIAQSGVGKVNAAVTATRMAETQPDLIINTGAAGGVDPTLKVGDVVIATATRYHDVDATAFGNVLGQVDGMPERYPCAAAYLEPLQRTVSAAVAADTQVVLGEIVSGDSFIASDAKVAWLRETFPEARCVEMESTAIGQVCYRFGVPYLAVRALSDDATHRATQSFETTIATIGQKSAAVTLAFLRTLKADRDDA